jgi:hypothetical protein
VNISGPLLTDERLRNWLDGNQPQRERLCLALLALDSRYAQAVPRRPRGGPDGGRDIEALFEARSAIWGSVGFRNAVRDSAADKRWVRRKFTEDVRKAKRRNKALDHFIFFTNVDLTPAENTALQSVARKCGMAFCDIYYRERIRMLLDSAEGLALRYQYLGVEMSAVEQAAFFAKFGDSIQRLLELRFAEFDRRLDRLEFYGECLRPTRKIGLRLTLRKTLLRNNSETFVVLLCAVATTKPEPQPTLGILICAAPLGRNQLGVACLSAKTQLLAGVPPTPTMETQTLCGCDRGEYLVFDLWPIRIHGFSQVRDFDRLDLKLYANRAAIGGIAAVDLVVNNYILASSDFDAADFLTPDPDDEWVTRFVESGAREQMLMHEDRSAGQTPVPTLTCTDFSASAPIKVACDGE